MTDETLFLDAIFANPDDRRSRLAYADWLDYRNDPHGELISLEEETLERVAWDDALWQLKPRRNELRRQVDAHWFSAMGYGQTCEPLFRGQPFPTDLRDAWRLIREAHERWTGESMPDVGGHRDKVFEAEKRLGLTFPPTVQEYVAFAFDLPQPEHLPPEYRQVYREWYSIKLVPGQLALSVLELFEGDRQWGVPFDCLIHEDPPVHTYSMQPNDDGSYEYNNFAPVSDPVLPLTQFMFWQAHTYCDHHAGHSGHMIASVQDLDQARSQLREQFSFHSQLGGTCYFETRNFSA